MDNSGSAPVPDVYTEHQCGHTGHGAEAIAEARYLNISGGYKDAGIHGLLPNYQYEIRIPNSVAPGKTRDGRADILYYRKVYPIADSGDPDPTNAFVAGPP